MDALQPSNKDSPIQIVVNKVGNSQIMETECPQDGTDCDDGDPTTVN